MTFGLLEMCGMARAVKTVIVSVAVLAVGGLIQIKEAGPERCDGFCHDLEEL